MEVPTYPNRNIKEIGNMFHFIETGLHCSIRAEQLPVVL